MTRRLKKDEKGEVWLEPADSEYKAIGNWNFEAVGVISYIVK
jgi:SOS-response transcriptional repressor LexA